MDGTRGGDHDFREIRSLGALEREVEELNLTPGWIKRDVPILWREPKSAFVPAHWQYAEAKAAMEAAGRLIGTDLAERRNLVMRNPIPGNNFATACTLVCAYQTIMPGETARSHRHAPHAFRVILDAEGAYSIVDGEKTPMETGDVVLTPGWCWHGHGHDGDRQAYWFDGLDVPLTHLLEPMFVEDHPAGFEPVETVASDSPYRFTWAATQRALDRARPDPEGFHGPRIEFAAPTMPTMGLSAQRLESGQKTRPFRSSANTIYVVMAGAGTSAIGDTEFAWSYGDTIVAPCWQRIEHRATADSVLFAMTDEPLMRFARYYRFEAL
ncbi:MAG: cupin domain-containing protein [Candidatus Eiseniibacteriota bacterium]